MHILTHMEQLLLLTFCATTAGIESVTGQDDGTERCHMDGQMGKSKYLCRFELGISNAI